MPRFLERHAVRALVARTRIVRVLAGVAVAGWFAASCGDKANTFANVVTGTGGGLTAIAVSPTTAVLAFNGTQQFTAVGNDATGATVAMTPTWSVVAGGGAISSSGMFTAGTTSGTFTATVKATSGSVSGTATVIVTPGVLATITVAQASMVIGATQQLVAVGKDASGNIVPITPTWAVIAGGGTVSASGVFTAGTVTGTFTNTRRRRAEVSAEPATVTVTAGPLATIVVTPNPATLAAGFTQQFTAVGKDASGNVGRHHADVVGRRRRRRHQRLGAVHRRHDARHVRQYRQGD